MPFTSRTPTYLTSEQRHALTQIPADLSDREIARYYTFSQKDLDLINQRRRHHNRLGFAVQLAVLRFPGRPLKDLDGIPPHVLLAIADQVQIPASAFAHYGNRDNTLYEHLDEIRRTYTFRDCGWREYLWLARELLPLALESDRPVPLIEQALDLLRSEGVIAHGLVHLERLVWIILKAAEKRLFRLLTTDLTLELRTRLDRLLMDQSCPYTYRQLSWLVDWYIREETLLASLACLDNFVLSAPLSRAWGDGSTSSSDGMRMPVGVKAVNAEYNAKYFGVGRGTNIYVHAADIWMPFGKPQVIGTNEEALYVIDALCHHESDLQIREHFTGTGGSTEQVFALATLLGFRFAPRISDALPKKLYLLDALGASAPLDTLIFEQVNKQLIVEQWEEMQRVASSIRHGTVSASLLMRKLAAYPCQNQVVRALTEFGKLERTSFLLEYFRDAALRRRILIGLNKSEALHSLARQLFFGRLGELRDRALEDQIHRASCLHLLIAAIAAWNTIYLTEAFAALRRQGEVISETTVAHIAPLGWEHINLIGKYQFAPQPGRSLENLRPLRLKERKEGEEAAQEAAG